MTVRNLYRNTKPMPSLAPVARVTGTLNGTGVDLRGYDSASIIVSFGAYTDGTHMPSVEHSTDNATFTAVSESDLDGSFAVVSSAAGANTVQSVGYLGAHRYVRVVMTVAGATTGALSAAQVLMGHPRMAPVV
ncbi:MAG: hypothetical protein PHD48_06130 [Alphaproteobacteria bacterium]|nr:hypothetical protein [Alphaproteobacteria bacterium]